MLLAFSLAACGAAPAPLVAPPFPDAGPSLSVALLQPLPGASFPSDGGIPVIAEIQALDSPATNPEAFLGGQPYPPTSFSGQTAVWTLAAGIFDAGVYQLQVVVSNTAGQTATARRSISITP